MEPEEDTQARKAFERMFRASSSTRRGSEEEIVVYKQMAWTWFVLGRVSLVDQCREKLAQHLTEFNDMEKKVSAGE